MKLYLAMGSAITQKYMVQAVVSGHVNYLTSFHDLQKNEDIRPVITKLVDRANSAISSDKLTVRT